MFFHTAYTACSQKAPWSSLRPVISHNTAATGSPESSLHLLMCFFFLFNTAYTVKRPLGQAFIQSSATTAKDSQFEPFSFSEVFPHSIHRSQPKGPYPVLRHNSWRLYGQAFQQLKALESSLSSSGVSGPWGVPSSLSALGPVWSCRSEHPVASPGHVHACSRCCRRRWKPPLPCPGAVNAETHTL